VHVVELNLILAATREALCVLFPTEVIASVLPVNVCQAMTVRTRRSFMTCTAAKAANHNILNRRNEYR
jgi:hypothetical protein